MLTIPQSTDVPAKRALNTDLAAEEASASLMKKPKIEEEEKREEEEEEEDDDDDDFNDPKKHPGYILVNNVWLPEYKEMEAEWDVDSHDGLEYESDPDDKNAFSNDKEYQEYRVRKREIFDSKGFLPDPINEIWYLGDLDAQATKTMTNREFLTEMALVCINKLNEVKGTTVELDSIVRATVNAGAVWKLRITIMAREYQNGPLVEYQAKVMIYAGDYKPPFPIFCRPSPTPNLTL